MRGGNALCYSVPTYERKLGTSWDGGAKGGYGGVMIKHEQGNLWVKSGVGRVVVLNKVITFWHLGMLEVLMGGGESWGVGSCRVSTSGIGFWNGKERGM